MKNLFSKTRSLILAFAAFSIFSNGVLAAQSGEETLWLKCKEATRGFDFPYAMPNNVLAVRDGNIVLYNLKRSGEIDRWGDLCNGPNERCSVNDDEIFAFFQARSGSFTLKVNRRTGAFEIYPPDYDGIPWSGRCERITDPRPPAAF